MKPFLTLMCCLALTSLVRAEQDEPHKKKKNANAVPAVQAQAQQQQVVKQGKHHNRQINTAAQLNTGGQVNTAAQLNTSGQLNNPGTAKQQKRLQRMQAAHPNANLNVQSTTGTTFKAKRFQLSNSPNPTIKSVTFSPTYRIQGAQNWNGQQYVVFRNYQPSWHDQIWWGSHYSRISLFGGGYYYLNNGYWYPAWGYDHRYQYYPYDGPIYAYNDLPPDQVIANVQAALQAQGYYRGDVDGLLGPLTRAALAGYQRDHGLYTTAAIDRPTLSSLGMS